MVKGRKGWQEQGEKGKRRKGEKGEKSNGPHPSWRFLLACWKKMISQAKKMGLTGFFPV
jgi:hypothetical protein